MGGLTPGSRSRGLGRAEILAAEDLPRVEVLVAEWGGSVYLRGLTGQEYDRFDRMVYGEKQTENVRARLVAMAMVDEGGNRVFADADLGEGIRALGLKSGAVLDRLFETAQELSGIGARAQRILEKNSDAGPAGGSPSD